MSCLAKKSILLCQIFMQSGQGSLSSTSLRGVSQVKATGIEISCYRAAGTVSPDSSASQCRYSSGGSQRGNQVTAAAERKQRKRRRI